MILGIDPGRYKIGWALTSDAGELILSGIFPAGEMETFLGIWGKSAGRWEELLDCWTYERRCSVSDSELKYVALGDGVGSREVMSCLGRFDLAVVSVNEKGTTLAARDFYWSLHRPALWQRCLPLFLRFPPRDIDDLAAWGIALRSLAVPFLQMVGRE